MGYEGETSGFGIGFPFDRERKHTECKGGAGGAKGRNFGKGNADDTLLK